MSHAVTAIAAALAIMAAGCALWDQVKPYLPEDPPETVLTNQPTTEVTENTEGEESHAKPQSREEGAKGHEIAGIGQEEIVSPVAGDPASPKGYAGASRPSLALSTGSGQAVGIVAVWDRGTENTIWRADRKPGEAWTWQVWAEGTKGGRYDCSRIFLPHVELTPAGKVWISAKMGVKEYGKRGGQGIWPPDGPFVLSQTKGSGEAANRGNGNVCIVSEDEAVFVASDGKLEWYNATGAKTGAGQLRIGSTGEKLRACVAPLRSTSYGGQAGAIIHIAMHGYTGHPGMYRSSKYPTPVAWSDADFYTDQRVDMCHPSICADRVNPEICYIGAAYESIGILAQIVVANKPMFATTNLLLVSKGGALGIDRYGPQMAPAADGGVFIAYCKGPSTGSGRGGRIKVRYLSPLGQLEDPVDVCDGRVPTLATDTRGQLHMIYERGGMKYRRIAIK